jgi:isoleucyl-tRNA synthetase
MLASFPEPPAGFPDEALVQKWDFLLQVRSEVNRALEEARRSKLIGNSLEAKVTLGAAPELWERLQAHIAELTTLTMVSQLGVTREPQAGAASQDLPGLTLAVAGAEGGKCERCWNYATSVGQAAAHPTLCARCHQIIGSQ